MCAPDDALLEGEGFLLTSLQRKRHRYRENRKAQARRDSVLCVAAPPLLLVHQFLCSSSNADAASFRCVSRVWSSASMLPPTLEIHTVTPDAIASLLLLLARHPDTRVHASVRLRSSDCADTDAGSEEEEEGTIEDLEEACGWMAALGTRLSRLQVELNDEESSFAWPLGAAAMHLPHLEHLVIQGTGMADADDELVACFSAGCGELQALKSLELRVASGSSPVSIAQLDLTACTSLQQLRLVGPLVAGERAESGPLALQPHVEVTIDPGVRGCPTAAARKPVVAPFAKLPSFPLPALDEYVEEDADARRDNLQQFYLELADLGRSRFGATALTAGIAGPAPCLSGRGWLEEWLDTEADELMARAGITGRSDLLMIMLDVDEVVGEAFDDWLAEDAPDFPNLQRLMLEKEVCEMWGCGHH